MEEVGLTSNYLMVGIWIFSGTTQFLKRKQHFLFHYMFQHSYIIFSCKCSTVLELNFHCIQDYVTESDHKTCDNNLNTGISWNKGCVHANSTCISKSYTLFPPLDRDVEVQCVLK